jgi:large subunit ribosomal protein L10
VDRAQKEAQVAEIQDRFGKMASAVLTDFRGLDVEKLNELRREFDKVSVEYKVVKNTLVKRAIGDEGYADGLSSYLAGPTAIAWSYEDPVAPAKVVADFSKANEKLKIKCAVLDGEILDETKVIALSKMPGKDEIKATLLATFMAPAQQMVRLLAAAPTNFMYLLNARKNALGGE